MRKFISLNARGGHFVFNTAAVCVATAAIIHVLMPEVGILFLIQII